jgi:guanyl-specific ribonuclease Sa
VNETALPILTALAFNAATLWDLLGQFDPRGQYVDGMNLYAYGDSSPVSLRDPLGLDTIDDLINMLIGHKVAFLGVLNEGARWASIGLDVALNIASSLIPGAGIYDAYKSGMAIAEGEGGFWDYVAVGAGAVGATAIIYKAFKWGRRLYASSSLRSRSGSLAVRGGMRAGGISGLDDLIRYIKSNKGSAPPGYKGGRIFHNREARLPSQRSGYYREYDVHPHQPGVSRGNERLVIGDEGDVWYTADHYLTFTRIE